jgi:DNA repair protein RadC
MEKVKVRKKEYYRYPKGILVPVDLVRERTAKIASPEAVISHVTEWRFQDQEYILSVILDGANRIIKVQEVTKGTATYNIIHPREVFREAIRLNSSAIILVHNHPSGEVRPSDQDIASTRKIAAAGKIIGIDVLDHIIIGPGEGYCSIREKQPDLFP